MADVARSAHTHLNLRERFGVVGEPKLRHALLVGLPLECPGLGLDAVEPRVEGNGGPGDVRPDLDVAPPTTSGDRRDE
jgi:hypothetical protein